MAVDLEGRADYHEPPGAGTPHRDCFLAHFPELERPLREWDQAVERVQAAPAALWAALERAAVRHGITEPPFALGPLVDRLAILTVERARSEQLQTHHELGLEHFRDRAGVGAQLSVYLEGQHVARLPAASEAAGLGQLREIQTMFDDAQRSKEAAEITSARDAMLDLKQPLLELLASSAAADEIAFVEQCPVCRPAPVAAGA